MKFTRVGLGQILGTVTAKGLIKGEPTEAGYIDVGRDYAKGDGVLFGGPVKVPRKVKTLANSNSAYVAVVDQFLKRNGVESAKARITRVVMADLDGDGTKEVVIEASSRDNLTNAGMTGVKPGDYSLILLRYERDGKAVEVPLAFDHPKEDQINYEDHLRAIADLDGDGTMEVVVSSKYYEGESATMFRYRRGVVTKLVEMGDGV